MITKEQYREFTLIITSTHAKVVVTGTKGNQTFTVSSYNHTDPISAITKAYIKVDCLLEGRDYTKELQDAYTEKELGL